MLKVQSLSKGYGEKILFNDVSFSMSPGERLGLIGRNGTGKTTLLRMTLGQEVPDSGTIGVPRTYRIGHLSQHIAFSKPTLLEEACLGLAQQEGGWVETHKAEATLMGLGFGTEDFDRAPSEFSGGYQVRLQLAKVLLEEPNLLLLDEPTNYLDIISMRWLQRFLRQWTNELILITHDHGFMNQVTTHTMIIHRSNVRRVEGSTDKLYDILAVEEEVHEKTRLNEEKSRKHAERFINRFRAKASKAKQVQSRIKQLQKKGELEELQYVSSLEFKFNDAPFTGNHLVKTSRLEFGYETDTPLISGFELEVEKGDRIAVIGKNGKGKSTLLNLIAHELEPWSGEIQEHPKLLRAHFGQANIDRLQSGRTVEEEILEVHPDHDRQSVRAICGVMMFEGDDALKKVDVLSGGERARVLLGKLLVSPANFLLLDEPTNHLDMESIDSLIEAVGVFTGAVLIVTHNEDVLHALATRLVVFDGGNAQVFEGTYQNFLDRIGWSDEADSNLKGSSPSISKKDQRRQRAEIVAARSKALKPLRSKIEKLEHAIVGWEAELEEVNAGLLEASTSGESATIADLSKRHGAVQKRIDQAFEELEKVSADHDWQAREFDEQLEQLNS